MGAGRSVIAFEARLARWRATLAPSTRIQYDVYVRGLRASMKAKPLPEASRADVLRYLRALPSYWMQRRGLTALRACFAALNPSGVSDPTEGLSIGIVRGAGAAARANAALRAAGWSGRRIAALTWGEAAFAAFADRKTPRVVRAALRALVVEAFPGRSLATDLTTNADRPALRGA